MNQEKQLEDWCKAIRQGDQEAFNTCFRSLFPELTAFATRYLGDRQSGMDMVQDAFVKLWNMRAELDSSRSLRSLMYTMVRNQCLNHIRDVQSKEVLTEQNDLDAFENPEVEQSGSNQEQQQLHAFIADLPERQKECIEMSRFNGLSHDEIAEVLNLSARTVNNHIVAGLKTLRSKFEQYKETMMVL